MKHGDALSSHGGVATNGRQDIKQQSRTLAFGNDRHRPDVVGSGLRALFPKAVKGNNWPGGDGRLRALPRIHTTGQQRLPQSKNYATEEGTLPIRFTSCDDSGLCLTSELFPSISSSPFLSHAS